MFNNSTAVNSTTPAPTTIFMTTMITSAATTMFNHSDNYTQLNGTSPPRGRYCPEQQTNQQERIIKITAYSVILVVSLIGNILIAAVILSNKKMKKPTNYFILNMAISDLVIPTMVVSRQLVLLCTQPKHISEWLVEGTIGTLLCKLVHFFQDVTTAVSIFSLILITVDRFIAVVYPMKHYIMSSKTCKVSILATWLVGMSIHAVYLYTYEVLVIHGMNLCSSGWYTKFGRELGAIFVRNYYLILFFLLAVMPVVVMAVAYTIIIVSLKRQSIPLGDSFSDRQKRQRANREQKILRMAIAIIVTFVILWIPYNVFIFLELFVYNDGAPKPCFLITFHFIAFFCAYANAAVNPCIVFMFSQNFRHGFMQMLANVGIIKNRSIRQQTTTQISMTMQNKAYENDS
ncbi:octopamine receptor 1-like [Exaiptasia diaphana]|uniref:G-protein coupled receptors family 1 profile domain-containing protein n=1 Tax=Exaiptasia diaphana TaxID=2652724 RepID=A0A913XWC5_EXADI|nr:octopamine receptor 1-like [Exaiptasia diaphana]